MIEWFRGQARDLGFDEIGFAPVPAAGDFAAGERFRDWLGRGYAGEMSYLGETADRRADPHVALPGARTAVVLATRYPAAGEPKSDEGRVAGYARGRDYHNVLGFRIKKLKRAFRRRWPGGECYGSVDTGAVLEREWAARAGLGWIGKNTMLIDPERGSRLLLAVILVTLPLPATAVAEPVADHCGSCRMCLDVCPTEAFVAPYVLDARRCIAYLTIETRGELPPDLRESMGDHVFGCDLCQEVCPFNLRDSAPLDPQFGGDGTALHEPLRSLLDLDDAGFAAATFGRPLRRPGRAALVRNACVAAGNSGQAAWKPQLARLQAEDPSPVVREHAGWALGRLVVDDPGTP